MPRTALRLSLPDRPDDDDMADSELIRRIYEDIRDGFDEELELEIEDRSLESINASEDPLVVDRTNRAHYFRELFRLQGELVKLQDWVVSTRHKVVILFE